MTARLSFVLSADCLDMMAAPRFTLLVFDAMEGTWAGAFEPLESLSGRQILERVAMVDADFSNLFLLRMIPVVCDVPNAMNWIRVTVMVVYNVPSGVQLNPLDIVTVGFDLGLPARWTRDSGLPDVPASILLIWSSACGASLDPSAAAPMSLLLSDYVSNLPPARLREFWHRLATSSTPCSPGAREGMSERAALARASTNPYSASFAP